MILLNRNQYFLQLNEKGVNPEIKSRVKELTRNEFEKIYLENCKVHKELVRKFPRTYLKIWRGVDPSHKTPALMSASERTSAHSTENWYNLILSNDPEWQEYPRRSHGIIATTDKDYADSYGKVVEIIPFDNQEIAICPDFDIYKSFSFKPLTKFNKLVEDLVNRWYNVFINKEVKLDSTEVDFRKFRSIIDKISDHREEFKEQIYEKYKEGLMSKNNPFKSNRWAIKVLDKWLSGEDLYTCLSDLLDPAENGFQIVKYNVQDWSSLDRDDFYNREVWFEDQCLIK